MKRLYNAQVSISINRPEGKGKLIESYLLYLTLYNQAMKRIRTASKNGSNFAQFASTDEIKRDRSTLRGILVARARAGGAKERVAKAFSR